MRSQVTRHVLRRPPAARGMATGMAAGAGIAMSASTPTSASASASTLMITTTIASMSTATASSHLGLPAPRPTFRTYPVGCRVPRVVRTVQRRSFISIFKKPPRRMKALDAEPGYEALLTYRTSQSFSYRPAPVSELVTAWRSFFNHKAKHGRVVNSTQAECAYVVFQYFVRPGISKDVSLSLNDLHLAMLTLEKPPRDDPIYHVELSGALFNEIARRELKAEPETPASPSLEQSIKKSQIGSKYLHSYLATLSQNGKALTAKDIYLQHLSGLDQSTITDFHARRSLLPVINGLAKEGEEAALREIVREATKAGVPYNVGIQTTMTRFFAQRDDFEEIKFWFNRPLREGVHPSPRTYYDILQFALRTNRQEWVMEIYADLIAKVESGPWGEAKACWDVSFQYAFLLLRKGIDHIEHMFKVAMELNKDNPKAQPNIGSINALLKCAIDRDDPYMAERFIHLSERMRFAPDLSTYILQLEYRLRANDHEGAYATFQVLRSVEPSKQRELPVLNKLIRTLCASIRPDYEKVIDITSYLEQQNVTLEPETVVSVCMAFLRNDELHEVIDTLSLHTAHYSIAERRMVRKSFVNYCLDKNNSTARIWDAYAMLRQFFPELEREDRVAIMNECFERRRPDMACHVFGHMRAHNNKALRPTLETYVLCLEGLGRCPDEDGLRMIHNMAKMDATLQLNTKLNNALMIGYIACEMPYRALDFWKEVTTSPEGPSYATLEIALRAYQIHSDGDVHARELWAKLMMMDVDVPEHVYGAYLATLAAHNHVSDVKQLLDDSDNIIGGRPDFLTFAYVYNALPNRETKEDFESWSKHEYPSLWQALTKKHTRKKDIDGLLQFKVSRPWKA